MTYCYQNLNYMVSREIVLIGLDRTLEIENKLAQLGLFQTSNLACIEFNSH